MSKTTRQPERRQSINDTKASKLLNSLMEYATSYGDREVSSFDDVIQEALKHFIAHKDEMKMIFDNDEVLFRYVGDSNEAVSLQCTETGGQLWLCELDNYEEIDATEKIIIIPD